MKKIGIGLLIFITVSASAQDAAVEGQVGAVGTRGATVGTRPATISEYEQSFPTYAFSDPSPVPLLSPVYPYFRYDGFTNTASPKKWKVVALENAYLRLLILPEIGGKLWAAIEKSTDRPFLYYNHAVKFRDIAMRGPWTSGGLEANFGIMGHTPACATPVDYVTRVNEDGSASCIIGCLDLLTRSYWRVEIRLPRDEALFTTTSFWYNSTPLEQPYYHWMNAGLKASDGLEFIFPGNKYLGHSGEYASWPVNKENGKTISWYRNNDFGGYKSYHVFGRYTDFSGTYWHNQDMGMVRYGTHDDKAGKKIWIWGLSRQGMIWEHLLTDTDGQYVESQSGRLFNQNGEKSSLTPFKHRGLAPYETDSWKEYWYPVLGTKGFVAASEYGALNLRVREGVSGRSGVSMLLIDFCPVQAFDDTIRIRIGGKIIYEREARFTPLRLFADSVAFDGPLDSLVATIGASKLVYAAAPQAGVLSRPVEAPADFDWTTAYGYYLKGQEATDQKNYPAAEQALDSALIKDPNFLPALVSKANLFFRNMRYAEALVLAKRALSINTEDGSANFIYGLINEQLGSATDAKDGFDIASLDPAWRSAAYTSLARVWMRESNLDRAFLYTGKAMAAQEQNMEALQLRAVIARLQGHSDVHAEILHTLLSYDPLNHFARFEQSLTPGRVVAGGTDSLSALIRSELPQETYLELGIWYARIGLTNEAIQVFRKSPPVPEIRLWLAWLTHEKLDVGSLDPTRSFPFRSETATLLEALLPANPGWFLRYQLALIYKDRNRVEEARTLLASCGDDPGFAPFYATRAALDTTRARQDLERAVQLDPSWRYQKLLAEYELAHGRYDRAEAITGDFYRLHPESYIMGMLYARTLLLTHQYAEGDRVLSRLTIIPFEGATAGRELYREAKLMQAVACMKRQQYRKALSWIDQARQWPENLGVGEPYAENEDLRLEDWMSYRCYGALHREAAAQEALRRIIGFHPRIDNTVPNFIPANAVGLPLGK